MKKTLIAVAAGTVMGMTLATSAMAAPIYLNNGIDFAQDSLVGTQTSAVASLGYTGTLATSIYLGNPAAVGTQVVDTNIASVMNGYGFVAGAHTAVDASTPLNFLYPSNPAGMNVNALNNSPAVVNTNGFTSGEGFPNYGVLGTWGLTYTYVLNGVTTGSTVAYNAGYFDVFYEDGTGPKQVARMNVKSSETLPANLNIFGWLSFDFDGNGTDDADAFVQDFWKWTSPTAGSFYDQWLIAEDSVQWTLSTNVNPPIPTADQLWQSGTGALIRQTALNGEISFNIPEPGSLALLGLGLAGLGLLQRRRQQAK